MCATQPISSAGMQPTIFVPLALLLLLNATTTSFELRMAGKGFGNVAKISPNELKSSRPQEHRSVYGSFAKFLSKTSAVFEGLKNVNGCSKDIYVRQSNSDTFWFVGKINHVSSIVPVDAVSYYCPLIVEYAKSLRPKDLAGKGTAISDLQVWTAKGNSEMDVVQNIGTLEKIPFLASEEHSLGTVSEDIGFEPEIYMNGEMGFRVKRDNNGAPVEDVFEVKMGTSDDLKKSGISSTGEII